MSTDGLVPIDPIRRQLRTIEASPIDTDRPLATVEGWQILALFLDGRITAQQAMSVNSQRVRQNRQRVTRQAA